MTDPIADMLARIRNAVSAKHSRVDIPASKLKLEIARILKEEGYINNFVLKGDGAKKMLRIFLRYDARGRPHRRQRVYPRDENFGLRLAFAISDFFAITLLISDLRSHLQDL